MRHVPGLVVLGLLLAGPSFAEIYKWTDANGNTHFSDRQGGKGTAQTVQLQINSYKHVSYSRLLRPVPSHTETPSVILYGTRWCGYCKKAREYFRQKGIAYTEYDVEHDAQARQAFNAMGGKGVPVIVVGTMRMNGFTVQGYEQLAAQARRP